MSSLDSVHKPKKPLLVEIYKGVEIPKIVPTEEELALEKVARKKAIKYLREFAASSRNAVLKKAIFSAVGYEPSGLRKPCGNVNEIIDFVIRSLSKGVSSSVLLERFGANFLSMNKIIAYAKLEHRVIIKLHEESNAYFWIPPETDIDEASKAIKENSKTKEKKGASM